MKITSKHKMKDLATLGVVVKHDSNFMSKVAEFECPDTIDDVKLKLGGNIPLQYIVMCWDIKSDEELKQHCANGCGLNAEKIDEYPLIDFLRLTLHFQEEAEKAAKMFMSLAREPKNEKLKGILSEFKTSKRAIFAEIMVTSGGAYTQEMAADLPWILAYDIIERNTIEYDKQMAIAQMQEEEMNHGSRIK